MPHQVTDTGRALIVACLLAAMAIQASAAVAEPPENDDYLAAIALNAPGSEMPRDTVTTAPTSTADATVQADLLSPPAAGGPPEPSSCGPAATPFGRTVWYRFFPDAAGTVTIQAIGFDATVGLVTFVRPTEPLPQDYACADDRRDSIETLSSKVQAGFAYAVQVGGSGGVAGVLQVGFSYRPDRDGDGIGDDEDRCPTRRGTLDGCPPRITVRAVYTFDRVAGGVKVNTASVQAAPAGARIDLRCKPGCGHRTLTFRPTRTMLPGIAGRFFPKGSQIDIRVTKPGFVGDYVRLTVLADAVSTSHRCMQPGTTVPRRICA